MLTQLIDQIDKSESILDKFITLEKQATLIPQTTDDLLTLLKLRNFRLNEKEFPVLKHTEIFVSFAECKQVLVQNNDYYYI